MSDTPGSKIPSPLDDLDAVAQGVVDQAAATIAPEKKALESKEKVSATAPSVQEHPISAADAQKFAGAGDFSLPVSPLDDLIGGLGSDLPKKTEQKSNEPAPLQTTKMVAANELSVQDALSTVPKDAAAKKPLKTQDLEKQAKEMLKDLGSPSGTDKPRKRRSGGAATKMALAALLVTLMGAGGIAGVNLLKLQQSAENRSQAWNEGAPWCDGVDNDKCTIGRTQCQSQNGANTGYRCTCVDLSPNSSCNKTVWSCGAYDPSACPPENAEPGSCDASAASTNDQLQLCCSNNTCDIGSDYGTGCYVSHFFSPDNDTDPVVVANCHTQPNENNVETLACAVASASFQKNCGAEQIDIFCNGHNAQISRRYPTDCTTSSPPPTGETPLTCTGLSSNAGASPQIGQTVTFTCGHAGDGFSTYQYRYSTNGGQTYSEATTNNTLTISAAGSYTAQCRVCKADNTCTTWGLTQ